jgi:hypothetical protein
MYVELLRKGVGSAGELLCFRARPKGGRMIVLNGVENNPVQARTEFLELLDRFIKV